MFGKEFGSADTKDFINVSGKLAVRLPGPHILNHLDTLLSNNLGVSKSPSHASNFSWESIPSLTIEDGNRLSKALTGQQLSTDKWFCNFAVKYQ